jgi:hypothetical protein
MIDHSRGEKFGLVLLFAAIAGSATGRESCVSIFAR